MADAFKLLLSSAKRRKKEATGTPTPTRKEYAACPVCTRSIPLSFLDIHVQSCLSPSNNGSSQQQERQPCQPHETPATETPSQPQRPTCSLTLATPDATPHRSQPSPPTGPAQGLRAETPAASSSSSAAPAVSAAASAAESDSQEPAEQSRAAEGAKREKDAASRGGSALQVLMQAQRRQQPQTYVFFLEYDHTAGPGFSPWRCFWWRQGSAPKQRSHAAPKSSSSQAADLQGVTSHGAPAHSRSQASQGHTPPNSYPAGSDNCSPPPQAAAPKRPQSEPAWSAVTVVKEKGGDGGATSSHVVLQTNVMPGEGGFVNWDNPGMRSNTQVPTEGRWRGHPSAIKSALQKAVRRGMAASACRLTLQMLKDEPAELLRRLPIICLEDTTLHFKLPVLVWLMCAQAKGFQLGAAHVETILDFTYQLACVQLRDHLPTHPPTLCPGQPLHSFAGVDEVLKGDGLQQESVLVKAMLLRASYGGMPCDVDMCRGYAQMWAARFAASAQSKETTVPQTGEPPLFSDVAHPPAHPQDAGASSTAPPAPASAPVPWHTQPSSALHLHTSDGGQLSVPQHSSNGQDQQQQQQQQQHQYQQHQQFQQQQEHHLHHQQQPSTTTLPPPPHQQQEHCGHAARLSSPSCSPWLAYLLGLFGSLRAVPPELSCPALVGPLRRSDVHPAAIDFHVSDVTTFLLDNSQVAAVAQEVCGASWGYEGDVAAQLRNAMWLFRSSMNHRAWLPLQPTIHGLQRGLHAPVTHIHEVNMDDVAYEHQVLLADLEQEAAQRDRLLPMWRVAEPLANSYAANLISKRFQPVF